MKKAFFYLTFPIFTACQLLPAKNKLAPITQMPVFKIVSLDNNIFLDSRDIPTGSPTLFMYFNPDCDHCQMEMKDLLLHWNNLQGAHVYLVTNDPVEEAMKFYRAFRLDTAKNIFVGRDISYSFFRFYLPEDIPYIAIYDSQKKLKKIYLGETDVHSIVNSIRD